MDPVSKLAFNLLNQANCLTMILDADMLVDMKHFRWLALAACVKRPRA